MKTLKKLTNAVYSQLRAVRDKQRLQAIIYLQSQITFLQSNVIQREGSELWLGG
jgi:hypothetical protein